MRVRAAFREHGKLGEAASWARQHEELGFDDLQFPESAHNPFVAVALAAQQTESASLATRVAIAFARSPYVVANLGWDLQEYSQGRFMIGLGTQVRAHNERRFSVPWSPPNPRLREYVEMVRAVWHTWRTGESPSYEGEHYQYTLDSPMFNAGPIDYPDPLIVLAATLPRNTRLAGRVGDGVMWNRIVGWKYRDQVLLPALEEGARAAGKDPRDLVISGGGFVVTAPDEERLAGELEEARRMMAFYASTREYREIVAMAGFEREATRLYLLSLDQRWADMKEIITDDFAREFAVIATWDELPEAMAERYGGVNTEISFPARIETPDEAEHAREVIARLQAIPAYGEEARVPAAR